MSPCIGLISTFPVTTSCGWPAKAAEATRTGKSPQGRPDTCRTRYLFIKSALAAALTLVSPSLAWVSSPLKQAAQGLAKKILKPSSGTIAWSSFPLCCHSLSSGCPKLWAVHCWGRFMDWLQSAGHFRGCFLQLAGAQRAYEMEFMVWCWQQMQSFSAVPLRLSWDGQHMAN